MDRVMRDALRNLVGDSEHYKAAKVAKRWYG
jgi:hypothetical protein